MTQVCRLASGGRINRKKTLSFTFNGKVYEGYEGDTVASALLANGVSMVGRSWKYHRPRGILGSGAEEPNGIFQIGSGETTIPNPRATQTELREGLEVASTNVWPSLDFDLLSVNGLFSRFMPAGFYYKTFMWPQSMWLKYEHYIRKASGLGKSPVLPDPDHYEKTNAHCDLLVAGAGPAGLAAALAAGRAGARVIIADEQNELGGSLLHSADQIDGVPAAEWVASALAELEAMPEVRVLKRSTVYAYVDYNFLAINERLTDHLPTGQKQGARERLWRVRAKRVVLATGAHERPLVFGNNDRPGVMLADAVSCYINRYGVVPGKKAVIFTNNDTAYQSALDLKAAGAEVAAIVDSRRSSDGALIEKARQAGIRIITHSVVAEAKGKKRVDGAVVMGLDSTGKQVDGSSETLSCDLIAMSGGWSPVIHLFAQSMGKAQWDEEKACFLPGKVMQKEFSVGACNGSLGLDSALEEGVAAAKTALGELGIGDQESIQVPQAEAVAMGDIQALWLVPSKHKKGRGPKQFVDYQNDACASDIMLAAREGFRSIEHVKRYTALGFGTDQGKVGNINGMGILAETIGQDIPSTGTTTFRPNYTPITFGGIIGPDTGAELFDPVRKTAVHGWHEEHGAEFENVGQWKRPWYYPKAGESMDDAVNRECLATRNSVGMMDASTLGKIEITGPDAGEFLNRIYTNAWKKLGLNRARYGFMLGEDGMVMDDGVTICIGENHYFMHTTTGGAATVLGWMERWHQTEWPEMQVFFTSVTDHWATSAVVGPNSRKVVSQVCEGIDFDAEAFPFMSSRTGTFNGVEIRVNRISFSGELAYEVNIPAHYGRAMWEALMAAGEAYDITPYGTETMHVLRAEKGYVIVGQDTDGSVTAEDLGMSWILSKNKDFLGKRSLTREDNVRPDRKQFVGLITKDPKKVIPEGAQIVNDPNLPKPVPMQGHVTSSYYSACLEHSIALAVVKGGHDRMGETVYVPLASGEVIEAEITSTVFYDPEGARQNV